MDESFSAREDLDHFLYRWWVIVIFMIVGALGGWFSSFIIKPVYEAQTSISVNIDFLRTGKLTDVEEDTIIGVVGDYIQSDKVMDAVKQSAQKDRMILDLHTLDSMLAVERKNTTWNLQARSPDPTTATYLVNIWLKHAFTGLTEATDHARLANLLQAYQDTLVKCLDQSAGGETAQVICSNASLAEVQADLQKTGDRVKEELMLAQGILPYTLFTIGPGAEVPSYPIRHSQGTFMLAGATVMFVAALWVLSARLDDKILGGKRHD